MMFKKIFLLIVNCCLLVVAVPAAQAQIMSNNDYIIKTEILDTADTSSVQDNEVKLPTQKPNKNTASAAPFSVSLSSDIIDFGILTPTNPIIRTVNLSIQSSLPLGYSVLAFENHPLKNDSDVSGDFIPDTTCDNGTCNQERANEWINPLTFGFGYRCDNVIGSGCDNSFSNANFYKPLANAFILHYPQSVMKSQESKESVIRLSYKVNISKTQKTKEGYNNTITYISVPNF